MKDKTKNTPQVLLRRALLVLLDAAIVAFSFYFALLLRADGAVEAGWWPHNRALLYENLPWIVAVYIVCFLAGGLYSVLWKYPVTFKDTHRCACNTCKKRRTC